MVVLVSGLDGNRLLLLDSDEIGVAVLVSTLWSILTDEDGPRLCPSTTLGE